MDTDSYVELSPSLSSLATNPTLTASSVEHLDPQNRNNYIQLGMLGQMPKWLERSPTGRRNHAERYPAAINWLFGPSHPHRYTFQPVFPKLQDWVQCKLCAWLPGNSLILVIACCLACWMVVFGIVLAVSIHPDSAVRLVRLACETRLWPNATFCGLDGNRCQPFQDSSFTFACPSHCASVQVLEPHTIGGEEIIYRSMVIGGPTSTDEDRLVYRGDSFICAAAIHAGIISNRDGGCGVLSRTGEQRHFVSSDHNGISSIGVPASFPLTFSVAPASTTCTDPQWRLLLISVFFTAIISTLTHSSTIFFASTFAITFFQVALASDPPFFPDFYSVISVAFERFLPTIFVASLLYKYCVQYTLDGIGTSLEKTVLWLGGCWIGALNNYTFDNIPISRLTPHDLQQQPGAILALLVIIFVILAAAIGQAWAFRVEGRLPYYLAFYLAIGLTLACLALVPGLQLRLHHYIIALLLLPGTSLQTRPSLLYQGILVGLFINGVTRWGYASILQTADALRGDGQLGSALPSMLAPILGAHSIRFTIPTLAAGFDGVSILINDVERYQASGTSLASSFNWTRTNQEDPAFFRFAFTGTKPLGGTWYGDYTKPGTWYANGTWIDPLPGPSR